MNYINMENFDWKKYLNFYKDLGINGIKNKNDAIKHYLNYGRKKGRIFFSNKNLAIIFSGKCDHRWNKDFDYFESFLNHIIIPLKTFNIFIFVGCYTHELKKWKKELSNRINILDSNINNNIKVIFNTDIPSEENLKNTSNIFSQIIHPDKIKYIYQYGKLFYTYEYCKKYCNSNNIKIDFVIKLRYDLIYKYDNFFKIDWFSICKKNYICIPSTEFHCMDRWSHRTCKNLTWPNMVCDQIVFGNLFIMNKYFKMYKSDLVFIKKKLGIEGILCKYLILNNIKCAAIELQSGQPGGKNILGRNNRWIKTKSNYIKYFN